MLLQIAERALISFRELERRWGNGRALLLEVTPERLEHDASLFESGLHAASAGERDAVFGSMTIRRLFPEWHPHVFPFALLLGFLALGQSGPAAATYARIARETSRTAVATASTQALLVELTEAIDRRG